MKTKKIVAMICALALAMALPMGLAFADNPSQEAKTVKAEGANGTTLTVTGTVAEFTLDDCDLRIEKSEKNASNTPSGVTVLASYRVYYLGNDTEEHKPDHGYIHTNGTLSFMLGCSYANYYFTCYVEHADGSTEEINGVTDASGNASFTVSKLSYYTFVIGDKVSTSTDSSATSPQTGVDYTLVAGISCLAIVGAGAAFAARRKLSK